MAISMKENICGFIFPAKMFWKNALQTILIGYYYFFMLWHIFLTIFILIYLLFTRFYFLTILYFIWYVYDFKTPITGGRRWKWLRKKMRHYFNPYFPVTVRKTGELPPDRNYIFACHPHGLWAFSHAATFASEQPAFSGLEISVITTHFYFYYPVQRELFLLLGACPSSRESIDYILSCGPGRGVAIVTGGARELFRTRPKRMKIFLKNRKGFIRMALRHGASLVPVISFGENDLYDIYPKNPPDWYERMQAWIYESFRGMIILANGRGIFPFGFMPFKKPINVIVGKPLDVPVKIPEPTTEQIDDLHQRYIAELSNLYEEYKHQYGYGDVPIELI